MCGQGAVLGMAGHSTHAHTAECNVRVNAELSTPMATVTHPKHMLAVGVASQLSRRLMQHV